MMWGLIKSATHPESRQTYKTIKLFTFSIINFMSKTRMGTKYAYEHVFLEKNVSPFFRVKYSKFRTQNKKIFKWRLFSALLMTS